RERDRRHQRQRTSGANGHRFRSFGFMGPRHGRDRRRRGGCSIDRSGNLIQKLRLKPKRTIRVIAWMNEENGLAGSKQYAKDHEKEWMNHFAAMETDGGADHPLGINIKAKPEVKKTFAPVAAILQASGAGMLNLVEHCGADIG